MAVPINISQQVRKAGLAPKAIYSRVVSVSLAIEPDDTWHYVVTPVLAQFCWLLQVQVWYADKAVDRLQFTEIEFVTGLGEAVALADVLTWERILPIYQQSRAPYIWRNWDKQPNKSWPMMKPYGGSPRRMGILGRRHGTEADHVQCSFEISEG